MKQGQGALVLVDDGERRARNAPAAAKTARKTARERRFSHAERAGERQHASGMQPFGKRFAESFGIGGAFGTILHTETPLSPILNA